MGERIMWWMNCGGRLMPRVCAMLLVAIPIVFGVGCATECVAQSQVETSAARLPAMAADASPGVEVAAIKPSNSDLPGNYFLIQPRRLSIGRNSVRRMICWAYDIHPDQIIGAPRWINTELFDIVAIPDGDGQPSYRQYKLMLQKLLADRFKLSFHHESRVFAVYAVTIAKGGPTMTPTKSVDPNAQPGMFINDTADWPGSNVSMRDFVSMMQRNILPDRPVVDQTGLTGRYDFVLRWTPDDAPPSFKERPDAPPGLFTAVQQELGLKLESTKAPVDVLVVDGVERPSAN
jgi:uncharacterized protein (TIGR03435 family)